MSQCLRSHPADNRAFDLVCLGCNKITLNWLCGSNNFSALIFRLVCQRLRAGVVPNCTFVLCSYVMEGRKGLAWVFLIRALTPFMRVPLP